MSKIYSVLGNKKALAITIVLILAIVGLIGAASADNLEPGQVAASKAAQAYADGNISGYDVGINIISAGFEEHQATGKKDVVLVLDISTSMRYDMYDNPTSDVSSRRITAAKAAANNFVDLLFAEGAADNRMAIVTFGETASIVSIGGSSNFSNNPAQIKDAINAIIVPYGNGTNPQAGFIKARSLVNQTRADADSAVIVLSDGQPTYSIWDSYWENYSETFYRSDRNIETDLGGWNYGDGSSFDRRHTDRTIMEANKLRALGSEIYTIAFTNQTGQTRDRINATMGSGYNGSSYKFNNENTITYRYDGKNYSLSHPYTAQFARSNGTTDGYLITGVNPVFDDFEIGYAEMAVGAGSAEDLNEVFRTFAEAIMKDIVATNAVLVDRIPEYFEVVLSSLPDYASYNPANRTITFNVGNIEGNKTISYKVVPVPGYNGLGYTNANTVLTFNPLEDNPFYDVATASIDILNVTNREDEGEVNSAFAGDGDVYHGADRNAPFVVDAAGTVLANDTTKTLHYVRRTAAEGYELVENSNGIYIKRNVAAQAYLATGPQYGSVVLNADGSFTYTYDLASNPYNHSITSDSFYYYLADADNLTATKSQPIKVTINLKELVDVSVHYRQNITGNPAIADITPNPKLIIKQVGDKISYVSDLSSPDTIYGGGDSQKPWLYNSSNPNLKAGDYTVLPKAGTTNPNNLYLYYDKGFDLSVDIQHYRESDENPLSYAVFETETITDGFVGQVINYASKSYDGYEFMPSLTDLNGNATSGGQPIFSLDNKTIKLYYNALPLTTTIVHYDVTGKPVNPVDGSYLVEDKDKMDVADITVNGKIYQGFTVEDYINQNIPSRTYKGFFGQGEFTTAGHVIHAYYERIAVNATIRYVEKVGTEYVDLDASQNVPINGYLGDSYDASQINLLTFPGFENPQKIVPSGGPFATNPGQDILVVYTRVKASVVVEYKDIANPDALLPLHSVVLPTTDDGKFGDKVTISTANITKDGILYVYNSIKEHGYAKPAGVDTELYLAQNPDGTYRTEDERVIVWMETVPAEITVRFYEVGESVDLTTPGKLEGVRGGSYATALEVYEATTIPGFTYSATENASATKVFVTVADGDIIIRYTRNSANISWRHKYLDVDGTDVDADKNGSQAGLYQSSVNIDKLSGDDYEYVCYSVIPFANSSLVSEVDKANPLNAEYGTADYAITLWYAKTAVPGEGIINVQYREEGDGGELIKTIPYSGAYSYQREISRVQTGETIIEDEEGNVKEIIPTFKIEYETVLADTFEKSAATDSSVADIPGFTPTGSVTLNSNPCPDSVDFTQATQTIIVWYTRDDASITLEFEGDKGNGVIVDLGSDTLNGKFDQAYDATGKIPAEITKDGVRYTGPNPAHVSGKFPAGDDNVITIRYQMVSYVTIPIKYYVKGTTNSVYPSLAPSSITGQVGSTLTLGGHPTVAYYSPSGEVVNPYGDAFPGVAAEYDPIIYYYEPNEYSVNVKYVEFVGFHIPLESLNGKYGFNDYEITQPYGTSYAVNKPTPEGFTHLRTSDPNNGVMGAENKDIYVVYKRKADCKVTVKYYDVTYGDDEDSKVLMGRITFKRGKYDYPFSSAFGYNRAIEADFWGYDRIGASDNSNGKFTVADSVVEVYYKREIINMELRFYERGKSGWPILASPLQSEYEFSGYFGTQYKLVNDSEAVPAAGLFNDVPWEIKGFELKVPAEPLLEGRFWLNGMKLYALYSRVDCTVPLLFKDVDTEEEIGDAINLNGPFGTSYTTDLNNGVNSFSKEGYGRVRVDDPNESEENEKLYELTDEMDPIIAWYQRVPSSVNVYYKQFGTETEIKDMVKIEGKYGDAYTVDTANFGRYRFHSITNPNTEGNGASGSLDLEMGDITVYYTRIFSGGGDPDPDPEPEPEPEPEVEVDEEEETPYGPVIPEPEEEVIVEAEEEEVPQGAIPAAGGTLTYLLAALGVAVVIAGGMMLKKARSQK